MIFIHSVHSCIFRDWNSGIISKDGMNDEPWFPLVQQWNFLEVLRFVFERNPDFAFYSVYNISNFILILKDVLYCYPYSPSKSSSKINSACYFVASCLLGIASHLPPFSLSCSCFGFPNSKWRDKLFQWKAFQEWGACKFRSSWRVWETVECLEAKSVSGVMNRHWSWRQEGTTPIFFTNQTMFFLLLFSSFCPYLLLRMSSPFFFISSLFLPS